MNDNQKTVGLIAIFILTIVIIFPPNHKETEHIYWNEEFTNMEKRVNYREDSWVFRPIWKDQTTVDSHSSDGKGKIKGTDIEKMAGGAIITDEFQIMKSAWFSIIGFLIISTIGLLILFKETNSKNENP